MKKKRIALIGATGQLGTDLSKVIFYDQTFKLFPLTHKDIEITDMTSIKEVIGKIQPDIIINTAAYHKVDEIEENPEKAILINGLGTKNLAQFSHENKKVLVFLSTDYVFGLERRRNEPYKETDCPGPINVYGVSKLMGEYLIRSIDPKYFIIRTSALFGLAGSSGKKGNFIETMLKMAKEKRDIRVISDQIITPTYTLDLANQIIRIIKTAKYGVFHASSEGKCSWYEYAKTIFKMTNTKVQLKAVTSDDYVTAAKRPKYSVLENYNLKKLGISCMREWKLGLKDYLKEKKYI